MTIRGIHSRVHSEFTEGCLPCRWATVSVAPSATPSRGRGAEAADINRRDKQLAKDRDAYKRLRKDGLQPNHVDGSAQLEGKVIDQVEIDYQVPIAPKDLPRVKDIQAEIALKEGQGPSW